MDLSTSRPGIAAALLIMLAIVSCSSEDFEVDPNALVLPGTLLEAYPIALTVARDWSDDVFVQSAGGGFTVMDAAGRADNHSFQFHSRRRLKNLTVHLFGGIPWTQDITDPIPPPPLFVNFVPYDRLLDSGDVVPSAVGRAAQINAQFPDSIPPAQDYAARLLSIPVWPEAECVGDPRPDSLAWRVDFLVDSESGGGTTHFSAARFYIHPRTGEHLGRPVVPPQPQLYPFPQGFGP
jgi:hypothetical protein